MPCCFSDQGQCGVLIAVNHFMATREVSVTHFMTSDLTLGEVQQKRFPSGKRTSRLSADPEVSDINTHKLETKVDDGQEANTCSDKNFPPAGCSVQRAEPSSCLQGNNCLYSICRKSLSLCRQTLQTVGRLGAEAETLCLHCCIID